MSIYASLQNSGRVTPIVETAIKKFKADPPDCFGIVRLLVEATGASYVPDSNELVDTSNYDKWIDLVANTCVNPQDFKSVIFRRISSFIMEFCVTAYRREVLFNESSWLEKCTRLLMVMREKPQLKSIAAYLGCAFFQGFYPIYSELCRKIQNNESIVSGSGSLFSEAQFALQVDKLEEDRTILAELVQFWKIYRVYVVSAIRSEVIGFQILKKIWTIFETCDIIYQENEHFMHVYWNCLQTTNFGKKFSSLCSLCNILSNTSLSDTNRHTFIECLVEDTAATILYGLATQDSEPILGKTLWILIHIHETRSNEMISSWSREEYETILTLVFRPKKSIRKLAGQLMLLVFRRDTEKDIFCEILQFFIDYSSDPADLPQLIDAIWEFEFIKKFENLFQLLLNPAIESNNLRNSAVSQFIVAIFENFLQSENYDEQRILVCLKLLPAALELMQDYPVQFELISQIFFSNMDFKLYELHYMSVKQIIKTLKYVLLNQTKYKTLQIAMNVFVKLKDIGHREVELELNEVVNEIYREFLNAHLNWTASPDEIDEEHRRDLENTACKMTMILAHDHLFVEDIEMSLVCMFRCAIINPAQFATLSDQCQTIEIFYLENLSNLLIMRIIDIIELGHPDINHIQHTKYLVENLIKLLFDKLVQPQQRTINNLFILEKILKILIHTILTVQPGFLLVHKERDELKYFPIKLELTNYNLIVQTCTDAIFENIDTGDNNCDTAQGHTSGELKQQIIKNFIRLHRDYNFLPLSNGPWKFFVKIAISEEFADEIDELLLVISNVKSPFETKGFRIASILSVVLVDFGNSTKTQKIKSILKRWTDFLKKNLDELRLADIFTTTVLLTIKKLKDIIKAIDQNRNRLLTLSLLKPFIVNDTEHRQKILQAAEMSNVILGRDEHSTLKEFEDYILN